MKSTQLQSLIFRSLTRKHGLKLSVESSQYLVDMFQESEMDKDMLLETLDYLAKAYVQTYNTQDVIERHGLEEVIASIFRKKVSNQDLANEARKMSRHDDESDDDVELDVQDISHYIQVISAFGVPSLTYDESKKAFEQYSSYAGCLKYPIEHHCPSSSDESPKQYLGHPVQKTSHHIERYKLIKQRLLRNDAFRVPAFAADSSTYFQITPIISLKGKKTGRYLLFGMLTQMPDGKIYLEDMNGLIQLHLSPNMKQGAGIFTLDCFVLVQGEYTEQNTFIVDILGMPLPENRSISMSALSGQVQFFGGSGFADEVSVLENVQKNAEDAFFVILSDVWLDQPKVLTQLQVMFQGYAQATIPLAFIFLGNFSSKPFIYVAEDIERYTTGFNQLADMLESIPELAQQSHFIFVPGPNDPWSGSTLPKFPLPNTIVGRLRSKLTHAHFMTNPCRIRYCTQEIVVFRHDLMNAMRRNAILPIQVDEATPLEKHLVSTILDQATLCPLPMNVQPIVWAHSSSLRLYPQPHLVILADKYDAYQIDYEGTLCLNPGSFPQSEFRFMTFYPSSLSADQNQIS